MEQEQKYTRKQFLIMILSFAVGVFLLPKILGMIPDIFKKKEEPDNSEQRRMNFFN